MKPQKQTPAEVSAALREQAFTLPSEQVLPKDSRGGAGVWCLIMETGYPNAVASLVTFIDGTTSMYFSTGGGVIGAGQHAEVSEASKAFIAAANGYAKDFTTTAQHPLPSAGRVRFYARTLDGLKYAVDIRRISAHDVAAGQRVRWPILRIPIIV